MLEYFIQKFDKAVIDEDFTQLNAILKSPFINNLKESKKISAFDLLYNLYSGEKINKNKLNKVCQYVSKFDDDVFFSEGDTPFIKKILVDMNYELTDFFLGYKNIDINSYYKSKKKKDVKKITLLCDVISDKEPSVKTKEDIVDYLISRKVEINKESIMTKNGKMSALHFCVSNNYPDLTDTLLQNGADIYQRDMNGDNILRTAMTMIARFPFHRNDVGRIIISLLEKNQNEKNIDLINEVQSSGITPANFGSNILTSSSVLFEKINKLNRINIFHKPNDGYCIAEEIIQEAAISYHYDTPDFYKEIFDLYSDQEIKDNSLLLYNPLSYSNEVSVYQYFDKRGLDFSLKNEKGKGLFEIYKSQQGELHVDQDVLDFLEYKDLNSITSKHINGSVNKAKVRL